MARNETSARYTAESLEHLAAMLDGFATSLRASAMLMKVQPSIANVEVKYESSHKVGFNNLRTWVNAAAEAVDSARLEASKKNRVREKDGEPKPPKT